MDERTLVPVTAVPEAGEGDCADDAAVIEQSWKVPERFAVVFDRHSDEIYRYVARRLGAELAEDVVADTFLAAFRKRARYDVGRRDARPWLYGIATHTVREHRRAEQRWQRMLDRTLPPATADSFEERSAARVTAERLQPDLVTVLARLSPADRDLLLLIAWADLSYGEAAEALGIPIGTVRSRLSRVRKKVRKALGGNDPMSVEKRP